MASVIANVGTINPNSSDLSHNSTASFSMGKDVIPAGNITGISLWLSAIRTYVSDCYLILTKGSATLTTVPFTNNSATHEEEVSAVSFNNNWLAESAGTVTITVKRTGSGSGAAINFRSGLYGELAIDYDTGERINIKISGVWKRAKVFRNVGGVWKQATNVYRKVSGVWKAGI